MLTEGCGLALRGLYIFAKPVGKNIASGGFGNAKLDNGLGEKVTKRVQSLNAYALSKDIEYACNYTIKIIKEPRRNKEPKVTKQYVLKNCEISNIVPPENETSARR